MNDANEEALPSRAIESHLTGTVAEFRRILDALTFAQSVQYETPESYNYVERASVSTSIVSDPTSLVATNEARLRVRGTIEVVETELERLLNLAKSLRGRVEQCLHPYGYEVGSNDQEAR